MNSPSSYKSLPIRCAPGVHDRAASLLAAHPEIPRTGVLDLASGSGALLARLADQGFSDLAAVELDTPKFSIPTITPMPLDLNADFENKLPRRYNLITAIEIIEHLDSPRHFLRSVHAALAEQGYLLISTPNIATWLGRVKFLLTGTLRYFDDNQYRYNHHVSPIPHLQMLQMLQETGFDLITHTTAGSFNAPLKHALAGPLRTLARACMGPGATGEVNIYLTRRTTPPQRHIPTDWIDPSTAQ